VVCRSVTIVSPAKTAEPIDVPFGMLSLVDPRNHVLDKESKSSLWEGAVFRGKGLPDMPDDTLM